MNIPGLDIANADALPWKETDVPGVSWIPLHLEEGKSSGNRRGGGAVLIRMDPGCGYERHRHVGPEDVLVLAGGYEDEFGVHGKGDHVRYPAGSAHAPRALGDRARPRGDANPACVLFASVPDGIELLGRAEA